MTATQRMTTTLRAVDAAHVEQPGAFKLFSVMCFAGTIALAYSFHPVTKSQAIIDGIPAALGILAWPELVKNIATGIARIRAVLPFGQGGNPPTGPNDSPNGGGNSNGSAP